MSNLTTSDTNRHTSTHGADMIQQNPTDDPPPVVAARYETADIPTLRRALLSDADTHENHANIYAHAETGPELSAWIGLLGTASLARMAAALLGIAQNDPGMSDPSRTRMTRLVGQVLDGWPEVLEGANDDLGADPGCAAIPGQQEIPAEAGAR